MGVDADDEILQDFLVEAGEILEQLSEQLVELESRPDDMDLLNAIFRGFHTVKGGAGFLQLNELVECCHSSENVFDVLRKGIRQVDAELMDVVLQGLDAINAMFAQVRDGQDLTPADPALLEALQRLADPEAVDAPASAPVVEPVAAAAAPTPAAEDAQEPDLTDAEIESLRNAPDPPAGEAEADAESDSDEITDAEFEALLDQLHGKGQFKPDALPAGSESPVASETPAAGGGDEITEAEFEALLDQLHGKGQFKPEQVAGNAPQAAATPAPAAARPQREAPAGKPAAAKPTPAVESETTVRVDTARLDEIMNMVGELVLV